MDLQNVAAVKGKVEILLSRIAGLERLFGQPINDEKETKLRDGLLTYANSLRSDWMLKPSQ